MRIRYSLIATLVTALAVAPALADTGFIANLSGLNEVGPNASPASGTGFFVLNNAGTLLTYSVTYSGLLAARNGLALVEKGWRDQVEWCAQLSRFGAIGAMEGAVIRRI